MKASTQVRLPESAPPPRAVIAKTRILIATDNPAATRAVATELRALDLDVQLCLFDGKKLAATPVKAPDAVLCHLTDYVERGPEIARALKAHFAPRTLPVIAALQRPLPNISDHFDSSLFAPMHPSQIANRVNAMIRLGIMETEIQRRMQTLEEDFGQVVALKDMTPERRFRVLFIGKASPAFMVIVNALQHKGVEIVAAFTSFSAFDYLHGDPFDAVVMNALEQSEPALTISETMRRNAKLYHVPTLFLVNPHSFRDQDAAYKRGARDIISIDADPAEISGRVLELANYHRIHEQLKAEIMSMVGSEGLDASATIFNRRFFDAHLPRMIAYTETNGRRLSVIALRPLPHAVETVDEAFLSSAYVQTGAMIKGLVRMQDVVARYDDNTFLLAFSDTDAAAGEIIMKRIQGLVDCAAFDSGAGRSSAFTVSLAHTIVEHRTGDTAARLIQTALSELDEA